MKLGIYLKMVISVAIQINHKKSKTHSTFNKSLSALQARDGSLTSYDDFCGAITAFDFLVDVIQSIDLLHGFTGVSVARNHRKIFHD